MEPTVSECGASVFEIDHNTALGMVYWLAEQCFVRWHR
ncbi:MULTISPECIES: ABC-three component system protein [unclassified Tardiphaga]